MPAALVSVAGALARRAVVRRAVKVVALLVPVLLVGGLGVGVLAVVLVASVPSHPGHGGTGTGCSSIVPAAQVVVAGLDAEQLSNAQTIVAVGREAGVPPYGWVVAVATALQESTLHNLDHGDRDSLGLFQQRAGWGDAAKRLDPASSARMFYRGGANGARGLLQVPGWQLMPLTEAAQAVQHSAFPDAYAAWADRAAEIVASPAVLSAVCAAPVSGGGPGSSVIAAGSRYLGTPYSWGGGGVHGPSLGFGPGADTVGFDCSSLAQYAWFTAANVVLPRVTDAQAAATRHLPRGAPLRAGDLLFFHAPGDPPGNYHHVGIFDGQGNMLHAPRTGKTVEVVHHVFADPYYASQFALATRPAASTGATVVASGP